ncbi:MAG: hypothetical protein L6Q98_21710 [Anaerolineae bacterium]|nr:hypothetical protein [Anaerolineae bacterium]
MRKLAPPLLIFLAYLLIAAIITYPAVAQIDTHLIGHPHSDAYEYIGVTWSIRHALETGGNPLFAGQMLYPDGIPAALALSVTLQWLPTLLLSTVLPLTAAFNLAALLTLALNGLAMFAFVRRLTGSAPAAFLAGTVWLAYPAFQGQLGAAHIGLLALWGAPLFAAAALDVTAGDRSRRRILAAGALFTLSLLGSPTLVLYLMTPLSAFLMARALWRRERILPLLAALALGGALWLPFVLPALTNRTDSDALTFDIEGDVRYSAPLVAIIAPSFYHPLYADLGYPRRALGAEPFEQTGYVGIAAALIGFVGLIRRRAARPWLLLAAAAWVLSLGPLLKVEDAPLVVTFDGTATPISLPWALLGDLPGVDFFRTPARFNFAVGFAVAVLTGFGAEVLLPSTRRGALRGWVVALPAAALILFDYQAWFPLASIPGSAPQPIRALSADPAVRAVFDLPATHPLIVKEAMFLMTQHGKPILTGQIARATPFSAAKAAVLQATLDPALLDAAGVDVIIVHRYLEDPPGGFDARLSALAGDPVYQDERYAVYRLPPYQGAPPAFTALTPAATVPDALPIHFFAPEPGQVTFRAALDADGRTVTAALGDDAPLARWQIAGETEVALTFAIAAGYHTLTLALDPPCTRILAPALTCRALRAAWTTLEPLP